MHVYALEFRILVCWLHLLDVNDICFDSHECHSKAVGAEVNSNVCQQPDNECLQYVIHFIEIRKEGENSIEPLAFII